MSTVDRKQAVPAEEVGAALHTALRKLCDGPESVYLWNVIHLLGPTWTSFCEAVAAADATTGAELAAVAKEWERRPRERAQQEGESYYAAVIFSYALEHFGEDDPREWDGFAGYLGPEA